MGKKRKIELHGVLFERLFSRREIKKKVSEFAQRIRSDYPHADNPPVLLIVLNGGLYLGVDLSRALEKIGCHPLIDTIALKSYGSDDNGGDVRIINYPRLDPAERDLIVIEDIIDRGDTLNFLNKYLLSLEKPPHSIRYCTLLMKTNHAPLEFDLEYLAWTVGPEWVIGNGMDSNQLGRGLSGIYVKKDHE